MPIAMQPLLELATLLRVTVCSGAGRQPKKTSLVTSSPPEGKRGKNKHTISRVKIHHFIISNPFVCFQREPLIAWRKSNRSRLETERLVKTESAWTPA
ncbi:unnamed protein product [Protopolystoma xenopodis]|uniref:Secreted protein n=1 Tax=Protopolystoma xenopodis TaxID=117903 RepID=A0A448WP70_9PLAT|nr:unnamed protein product [Protopolystoma xenopodis]